ncbi:MAG: hypothetical protein SF053_16500 [Bacteroidia bacterium]|nr:hypothetical protein [Bacteroidia bacterium]
MRNVMLSLSRDRVLGFKEHPDFIKPELFEFNAIHEYLLHQPDSVDENVLKYLKNGTNLASHRGMDKDIFNDEKMILGTFSLYTDGYWIWHWYITYYYEHYRIALPFAFLQTAQNNHFMIPDFNEEQRRELVRQMKEIFVYGS